MAHITMSVSDKDGMTSSTFLLEEDHVKRIFDALHREYNEELAKEPTYEEVFKCLFSHLMASVLNTTFKQEVNTKMREIHTSVERITLQEQ